MRASKESARKARKIAHKLNILGRNDQKDLLLEFLDKAEKKLPSCHNDRCTFGVELVE